MGERAHLDVDANELALVYRARGMGSEEATTRADAVLARLAVAPSAGGLLLETGADGAPAAEVDDLETHGTAWGAAVSSFLFFASGAVVPVLPYLLSGGTDNKALSTLGIAGYGFVPLQLPAGVDFPAMFHGVDERVPLDSLAFGRRVLGDLLATY